MTEQDQIRSQESYICELRVRLALAEKRVAQQQLIIDRLHRRLERYQPDARREAERAFSAR